MPDHTPPVLSNRRRELTRELICWGVLAVAFVLFARLSWRTWPDILVDFGQELYVPWRLTEGDVLYRDIAWVTGPLSQYANSMLFRVFGVSLTTLIFANLALLAGIVAVLYYVFRQCGTRWSATCVCLFFLAVFAFSQYSLIGNYNYLCPYRHDITHGLALGLINLLSLSRFGQTRRTIWLALSGLSLGLLSLTKIEMTLAAGLTNAVALPLFAWHSRLFFKGDADAKRPVPLSFTAMVGDVARWSGLVVAAALVPMAFTIAAFAASLGWEAAVGHVFLQYRLALAPELSAGANFYRAVSGTDQPVANLLAMIYAAVLVLAAMVAAYVVETTVGNAKRASLWATMLGIGVAYSGLIFIPQPEWQFYSSGLPLLLMPIILLSWLRALRDPQNSNTLLLLMAVYGFALLAKILLRSTWNHYGFVLAMPGTLVVMHFALHVIPAWWWENSRTGQCFQAVMAGLFAACALSQTWSWIRIDLSKTAVVGDGGDRFYCDPRFDNRTVPTVGTVAYLQEHMRPQDTLAVFPNGVMLNYLLRKRNPTPYIMFSPWESAVHGGEDLIADSVIQAAPDYAVIVSMDLTIHGRGNFGSPEFGGRIQSFLNQEYDIVNQQVSEGGFGGPFVATVFKRRARVLRGEEAGPTP